jgi:hypothetical protein
MSSNAARKHYLYNTIFSFCSLSLSLSLSLTLSLYFFSLISITLFNSLPPLFRAVHHASFSLFLSRHLYSILISIYFTLIYSYFIYLLLWLSIYLNLFRSYCIINNDRNGLMRSFRHSPVINFFHCWNMRIETYTDVFLIILAITEF